MDLAGLIYVKDKILQKFEDGGAYFIRFINAADGKTRIELAAETEEDRDDWFNKLSFA
jgi:hypothetical protein